MLAARQRLIFALAALIVACWGLWRLSVRQAAVVADAAGAAQASADAVGDSATSANNPQGRNQSAKPSGPKPVPFVMPPPVEQPAGYAPEVIQETAGGMLYRFSERQIKRMQAADLNRETVVAYLEARWPLKTLVAYCQPERRFTQEYQNLVPDRLLFDTFDVAMHDDEHHQFDKIFVYVGEEDWQHTAYYGDAGLHWHRWSYSLNILRGDDHWAIIENLPNDLMDHPEKYLPADVVGQLKQKASAAATTSPGVNQP